MAFENLRDQLKEQWAELSAKIQESPAFNSLRERFESQTPAVQRAIVAGAGALFALFLLSFPLGYLSTSNEHLEYFEENRELIRGLLRASRSASEPSPVPPPVAADSLKTMIEERLRSRNLSPEQIGEMNPIPNQPAGNLAPATVVQNGLAVQVKNLNLTQIVDIANMLQNLGPGTKLMGLDVVQADGQTHYYNIIARVVNFGLPVIAEPEEEKSPPARRPSRPRPSDSEVDE
ncbi:MAG: hypothetical protein AB7G93_14730 [Bdellovibrionales bacterium]